MPELARFAKRHKLLMITIADLIGDVDPIKAARGGHLLSDDVVAVLAGGTLTLCSQCAARREIGADDVIRLAAFAIAAVGLWLEPVAMTLFFGQINLVLLALVVGDLALPDRIKGKGIGIGLAAGIKLTPLIFIPYLLFTRRVKAAAVSALTFAVTVGLGFALLPHASAVYWGGKFTRPGSKPFHLDNQSLNGVILRLTHAGPDAHAYAEFIKGNLAHATGGRTYAELSAAQWLSSTYINDDSEMLSAKANERWLTQLNGWIQQADKYEGQQMSPQTARSIMLLKLMTAMPAPRDPARLAELTRIASKMEGMYGAGKYCPDANNPTTCMDIGKIEDVLTELHHSGPRRAARNALDRPAAPGDGEPGTAAVPRPGRGSRRRRLRPARRYGEDADGSPERRRGRVRRRNDCAARRDFATVAQGHHQRNLSVMPAGAPRAPRVPPRAAWARCSPWCSLAAGRPGRRQRRGA